MSYLSEVRTVFRNAMRLQSSRLIVRHLTKAGNTKDDEVYNEDEEGQLSVSELLNDEEDVEAREKEIERMRNKSRLNKTHRSFLKQQPKPIEEYKWDQTVYFNRKQFGRYGYASGVDPRLCFYTPDEVADKREYERVAYPYTIPEMVESVKMEKAEKQAIIIAREKKISQNFTKLDKWMEDLNARIAKKEEEARMAKEKRERLLEEIRQEFGFKIDFRDPRFKALMEKKELEQKKAKKMEKKKKREEQLMEKLKEQAEQTKKTDDSAQVEGAKKAKGDKKAKDTQDSSDSDSDSDSDDEKKTKK